VGTLGESFEFPAMRSPVLHRFGRPTGRRSAPPSQQAGFVLPLASTAALMLLLSSLSLQTVSLQARRQLLVQLQQRQQQDLLASAAQQLLGRLKLQHGCLLERPQADWAAAPCLEGTPVEAISQGQVGEHSYRLLAYTPDASGAQLRLALAAGGPSGAFALVDGQLRELGLRAAPGGVA
jgi:hypothetical protein